MADQSSSQLFVFDKMLQQILVTVAKVIGCFMKLYLEVLLCVTVSFRICPGDQDVRQWKTGGIMFRWCEKVMSY